MLCARMQMAQEDPPITCGYSLICFRSRTHFCKLWWRHDHQELMSRLRQDNEFFWTTASPTRGDRNPILVVDGMAELSGVEAFGLGIGVHWSRWSNRPFCPT